MAKGVIAVAVLAIALSACGGGGAPSTLSTACTSLAPPRLVYPASGATGMPTGFNLDVSYPQNPSLAFGPPRLTPSSFAGFVTGGPWSAAANSEWISPIVNLEASTTYSVNVTNTACNQQFTIGSFTTQ